MAAGQRKQDPPEKHKSKSTCQQETWSNDSPTLKIQYGQVKKKQVGQVKKKQVGQVKKKKEISIEHFGYTDGISQPIFLQNQRSARKEKDRNPWNPAAPLNLVLVEDKFAKHKDCFGELPCVSQACAEERGFFPR